MGPIDPALLNDLSLGTGLLFSLIVATGIAGDNRLFRLAMHILVGAGLGYAALLAWQTILMPRLFMPLWAGEHQLDLWIPLILGMVLLVAGIDRMRLLSAATVHVVRWRRWLHGLGRIPVAFILGSGLGVAMVGAIQGTFVPQYWRAARLAFDLTAPVDILLMGVFTIVITSATLVCLYLEPARHLAQQPLFVRRVLGGWRWVGQRALWFAVGIVFARLIAAHLSLLIARIEFFADTLSSPDFTGLFDALWRLITQ